MGQMAVDQPTTRCRGFPCLSKTVNVDGSGAVGRINLAQAAVFFGHVSQREDRPTSGFERGAEMGLAHARRTGDGQNAVVHAAFSLAVVDKRRRQDANHGSKGSIASEVLRRIGSMFGMQDPSQTLHQIERYVQEGRLELSEVMATQFCDMMLAKKKREPQDQIFLLKGLRLMCDIYLMRGKADQSMATIKRMHSERKALVKVLQKHAPQMLASMQPEHEDHLRAGLLWAAAGKSRKAAKAFGVCEKLMPGHLAAAQAALNAIPNPQHAERFLGAIASAGDVIQANGVFQLEPKGSPAVALHDVLTTLHHAATSVPKHAERFQAERTRLEGQQAAIIAGEQAANARLQTALDSLQPKHDYYQYG